MRIGCVIILIARKSSPSASGGTALRGGRRAVQQRVGGDGVFGPDRLTHAPGERLVAHDRLVAAVELGHVVREPGLDAAVAADDFAAFVDAQAVVHVALEVMDEPAEADLRLDRLPHPRKGGAELLRRGAGVQRGAPGDLAPFGGEEAPPGVVAGVVAAAVGAPLERVDALREAAAQTAEPAQVRDAHGELQGDEWMRDDVVELLVRHGLVVVGPGAVVGARIPEAVADAVVERTRARIGHAADAARARIDEVAREPRAEVRLDLRAHPFDEPRRRLAPARLPGRTRTRLFGPRIRLFEPPDALLA